MLRKNTKRIICAVLTAAVITTCALAAGGGTGVARYSNTMELADGFTYTNAISYNSYGQRVETFTAELGVGGVVYPIVMACDTIYGGMTISRMVSYASSLGYNVVGAVNSDFFSTTTKVPLGCVIENGEFRSSPEGFNLLAYDGGAFAAESVEVDITLKNNGGGADSEPSNEGETVTLAHLNKMRTDGGGLYLYTPAFSTVSTRAATDGWAVRMRVLSGTMTVSGTMQLEVAEMIESGTACAIGDGYVVLTAAAAANMGAEFDKFAVGDRVTLMTQCSDTRLASARYATGCGDVLVSGGAMTDPEQWDAALSGSHPRTAVGIKSDGSTVYYAVDGRRSAYSNGARLSEIAADLLGMGCVCAVNMDGGGSTALSLKLPGNGSCSVVNSPSDGGERSCGAYILFVTDRVLDGRAERLYAAEDGCFVLAGSTVALSYLATDAALSPAALPDGVTARSSGLGAVYGNVYTAGMTPGTDTLTLTSPSRASGHAAIHVITAADGITVTDAATGETPSLMKLVSGTQTQLGVALSYLSRPVGADLSAVAYSVLGDVGTVSEDGQYTASGAPGASGTITVSASGLTAELPVSIRADFRDIRGLWSEPYIEKLYDADVVSGVSGTQFAPGANIKRGDFVLMLWRAAGKPQADVSGGFTDVPADAYYAQAVAWAQSAGIAQGGGDGAFRPNDTLTREQAFTLLYRALSALGAPASDGNTALLDGFADSSSVAEFARIPAATLVSLGIVQGSGGSINPSGCITRAEMSKILCVARFGSAV